MLNKIFINLTNRSSLQELMDEKECDTKKLLNTVKQFNLINFLFTRSRYLIKKHIISEMFLNTDKQYTFLDLGSGGCDIAVWLLKYCNKKKLKIDITCIDYEERIIKYARQKYTNYPEIKIIKDNIYNLDKIGKFDFIFTNHFLHHFNDQQIPELIKIISNNTKKVFLLNDLKRSYSAYYFYTLFASIFLHNSFALYDGRLSIMKGFSKKEASDIIQNFSNCQLKQYLPGRLCFLGKN